MYNEEDYQKELKDCHSIMKFSEKRGMFKPKVKDEVVKTFFMVKRLIYLLLYYNVDPKLLIRLAKLKKKIQDELVLRDLRLIIKTVNHPRFYGQDIPLYDLICYGICGYIYALDYKYDITKGYKLTTYAVPWIQQHAQRSIEYYSKVIRLPNHVYTEISKVNMVVRQYVKDYEGESPNSEEITALINDKYNTSFTVERIEELGRLRQTHNSLDEKSSTEEGSSTLMDFVSENGEEEILEEVEQQANKDYVRELLSQLTHEEQKLINWKYGLIDWNTKRSSNQLAQLMNMELKDYKTFESQTMAKLRKLSDRQKCNL